MDAHRAYEMADEDHLRLCVKTLLTDFLEQLINDGGTVHQFTEKELLARLQTPGGAMQNAIDVRYLALLSRNLKIINDELIFRRNNMC